MMNETIEALKKTEKASATAIDLIIRQQAKIEELKAENERLKSELEKSKVANSLFSMYVQTRDEVITEAYKECIQRAKKELATFQINVHDT